ncbi:MAG: YaaC family protein [Bacillus sp. (in: firmicutes)]
MQSFMHNWHSLALFYSASTSQKYLYNCYQKKSLSQSETLSYQNCQPFMDYLEHAHSYYAESLSAPLSLQPILQFYGYIQLLKACVLTIDPTYPNSTSLLAHGVSSRKRKKQHYLFLDDEVKIQKNGLFTHISGEMFHMKHLEGTKVSMKQLVKQIPELHDELVYFNLPHGTILQSLSPTEYTTSDKLLDSLHITSDRLAQYIQDHFGLALYISEKDDHQLHFLLNHPLTYNNHPFRYNILTKAHHLIPIKGNPECLLPELLVHYLLLYNLSMIARYETEWWLDLTKTKPTIDFPIIRKFLSISQEKIPFLISNWLLHEHPTNQF